MPKLRKSRVTVKIDAADYLRIAKAAKEAARPVTYQLREIFRQFFATKEA